MKHVDPFDVIQFVFKSQHVSEGQQKVLGKLIPYLAILMDLDFYLLYFENSNFSIQRILHIYHYHSLQFAQISTSMRIKYRTSL